LIQPTQVVRDGRTWCAAAAASQKDERLRVKLAAAGYEEEVIVEMQRDELKAIYAEVLVKGPKPIATYQPPGFAYDPELERANLEFEQRKWQTEMEERQRREQREDEERQKREQREKEERQRKQFLEAEQIQVRREELARMRERDKIEDERKDSPVAKGKLFGDATRASAIRMGFDAIEIVAFFKNCEQLFGVYGVPDSLKAILIRPFLNEKARAYLAKLDPNVLGQYDTLKQALLREFKLTPNSYLEANVTLTFHKVV